MLENVQKKQVHQQMPKGLEQFFVVIIVVVFVLTKDFEGLTL